MARVCGAVPRGAGGSAVRAEGGSGAGHVGMSVVAFHALKLLVSTGFSFCTYGVRFRTVSGIFNIEDVSYNLIANKSR